MKFNLNSGGSTFRSDDKRRKCGLQALKLQALKRLNAQASSSGLKAQTS
jgi:hypothetical protein